MIDDGGCIPSRQLIQAFSYVSAVSPPSASSLKIYSYALDNVPYKPYYCVIVGHAQKVLRRGKNREEKAARYIDRARVHVQRRLSMCSALVQRLADLPYLYSYTCHICP